MNAAILDRFALPGDDAEHAAVARDAHDDLARRVNSVIPSIVRAVNAFRGRLRPREKHQFEVRDVLQECWLSLIEKDHYYDEARSSYITFAMWLVNQKLAEIRNRWHTVAGPKDTAARLQRGRGRPETSDKVRQTVREVSPLAVEPEGLLDDDEADIAARRAEQAETHRALLSAGLRTLCRVDPAAARILGMAYGVGGEPELCGGDLAERLGLSPPEAAAARRHAEAALKAVIEAAIDADA